MNEKNMIAGTKEEHENNGFDLLRYTAAFSVMMLNYSSYCMILSQNLPAQASAVMSRARHIALMFPGVVILFTMSGFLVAASFERAKTRKRVFPETCAAHLPGIMDLYDHQSGSSLYSGSTNVGQRYDFMGDDTDFRNSQYAGLSESITYRKHQWHTLDDFYGSAVVYCTGDYLSFSAKDEREALDGIPVAACCCESGLRRIGAGWQRRYGESD